MTELDLYLPERDLSIRPMEDTDYADWVALNREGTHPIPPNDPEAPDYTTYRHLVWENRTNANEKPAWIQAGIWHAGNLAGLINLYRKIDASKAQIGYEIARGYRRRRFATSAVEALSDYALEELEVETVEILVSPSNKPSQGVALKAGFERTGKDVGYIVFHKSAPAVSAECRDLGQSSGLGQSGFELPE